MFDNPINFLAVGVGAIISWVAGFVWFTVIFRRPYLEELGKSAEQLAKGPSVLVASVYQVAGNLVMAYVLAWILGLGGVQTATQGMLVAVVVWLGFVAAVIGPLYAFQAFSLKFFFINTGYVLVIFLIMGAILGAWK